MGMFVIVKKIKGNTGVGKTEQLDYNLLNPIWIE